MTIGKFTIIDTLKTWAVNQHAGKILNINGEGNHHFCYITANGENTLTCRSALQVSSIGKSYNIYDATQLMPSDLNKTIVVDALNLNPHGLILPEFGINNETYLNIYVKSGVVILNTLSPTFGYIQDNGTNSSSDYFYLQQNNYISLVYSSANGWYITSFISNNSQKNVVNYDNINGFVLISLNGNNEICKAVINGVDTTIRMFDGFINENFYDLTFELHVKIETLNTVTFDGISIIWLGGVAPTFNEIKTYVMTFRRVGANTFVANLSYTYSTNPLGVDENLTDLDILRAIRAANPTSQLPALWLDSEDPYTQWEGVIWNAENTKVTQLSMFSRNIKELPNANKLTSLQYLDCQFNQLTSLNVVGLTNLLYLFCGDNQITSLNVTGLTNLQVLLCYGNQMTSLNVDGLTSLQTLSCYNNQLTAIPTLTTKGLINDYDFRNNNFQTAELDRFRALGFTDESKLLPQNP